MKKKEIKTEVAKIRKELAKSNPLIAFNIAGLAKRYTAELVRVEEEDAAVFLIVCFGSAKHPETKIHGSIVEGLKFLPGTAIIQRINVSHKIRYGCLESSDLNREVEGIEKHIKNFV
ncbi:MAG: hypothetical protein NTZ97_04695 [Candidatus Moranbacteria bacterium]|nr:hypothetical protein [Candidatus Moranbacteria bacterium]